MVAQLIRANKDYRRICDAMYCSAPSGRSAMEVDFLLTRDSHQIAIEAKTGNTFSEERFKGQPAVAEVNGRQRRIIVYP